MTDQRASLPIAVFDSGIGGLTVLHELLVSLPEEDYVYLGDTVGFPYGSKASGWLQPRIGALVRFLLDRGAKLLVVACNSATSAGGEVAREVAAESGGGDRGRDLRLAPDRGSRHTDDRGERCLPARTGANGRAPRAGRDRGSGAAASADHPEWLPVRRGGDRDRPLLLRAAPGGADRHTDP